MTFSNLDSVLRDRAARDSARLAYAFGDERLTYAELDAEATRIAAALAAAGVRQGDRVALALPAGLDFPRLFWAVQRLGAASCAVNPFAPVEAVVQRAARIRPRVVIVADETLEDAARAAGLATLHTGELPHGTNVPAVTIGPGDLAFLQPTSGTSGESRSVMILQRNVMAVLRSSVEGLRLDADDVMVCWVPPWHDLGLVRFIISPVYCGAPCHIVTPSVRTIPQWLAKIAEVRGTVTGAPDFAWRLAARAAAPERLDLGSLRYAANGGEPVRASTVAAFEQRFGVSGVLRPGYGLAEATLGVSTLRPGEPMRVDERGHVSCGTPFPGVEVRIDGCDTGEILVRGPAVFAGYLDAPEETAATLRDGWLHTGDVGRLDADGHLYILGRKRAILKRGGAMLAPREVEEAAQRVAGVKVAAAVSFAGTLSEDIVVVIEGNAVAADVARAVRSALGFTPAVVLVEPRSIPLTANGKIRHDILRAALQNRELKGIVFDGRI